MRTYVSFSYTSSSTVLKYWLLHNKAFVSHVAGNNKTYVRLHVKFPIFLSDFNEIWRLSVDFSWNPCSGNVTDTCWRTAERDYGRNYVNSSTQLGVYVQGYS
jgi:hypothetical protein